LRWEDHLPWRLENDIVVCASSLDESYRFIAKHYAAIFEPNEASPFKSEPLDEVKERYFRSVGDFFEFKRDGETVGISMSNPSDWSTYYMRSSALLPDVRSHGLLGSYMQKMLKHLRAAGVRRVEGDTSPSNLPMIRALTRMKFNISGVLLSDRWGTQIHFTKFIDRTIEDVFLTQYCCGTRHQQSGSREN
jgi:RimJ/RimL family protein N-acetyltransferase